MVRVNQDEIVRKSKRHKKVDSRHAGMDFYADLDQFFKHNYKEYWNAGNSENLKIAFYEPDCKKLENLNQ